MKRCSTSLVIREMQIKTTMRYHFKLVRMAIIKKSTNRDFPGGVQWVGLGGFTAMAPGSIPGRGTKILQGTAKGKKINK